MNLPLSMRADNCSMSPLGRVLLHAICLCRKPAAACFFLTGLRRNLHEWHHPPHRSALESVKGEREFPRRCDLDDKSARRQELEEITQIERNARRVRRAARLMAALTALAVAGLGYPAILLQNFPYSAPHFVVNLICALGVGSLICLLAFAGLGMVYRKRQDRRKEACQTEFLQQCMLYNESIGRQELEEMTQIQRNARCVQRATWLMAVLTALVVAGLYYPGFLLENLLDTAPQFIVNIICALGVGSLVSLLAFAGLGMVYRKKLDKRRRQCFQMVARLLESPPGQSVTMPLRDAPDRSAGDRNDETGQDAAEAKGSA
jgi:hypothetical protein